MSPSIQTIVTTVASWDGVTQTPHRFGGVEFNLGSVEIGHVHNFGLVDIPFTRTIREQLVADGEAEPHHVLPDSGWISFYLRDDADTDNAIRLFRLSYLQKSRRRGLLDEQAFNRELAELGFSQPINTLLAHPASRDDTPPDSTG